MMDLLTKWDRSQGSAIPSSEVKGIMGELTPGVTSQTTQLTLNDYLMAFTLTTLAGLSTGVGGWLAVKILQYNTRMAAEDAIVDDDTLTSDDEGHIPEIASPGLGKPKKEAACFGLVTERTPRAQIRVWWNSLCAFMFAVTYTAYISRKGKNSYHSRIRQAYRILGAAQAFAGGVMICVCFIDLLPTSLKHMTLPEVILWMVGGVGVFFAIR